MSVVISTVFPLLMIVSAVGDVLSRRIPNLLVLLIAALFFPVAWVHGMPAAEMLMNLGAGMVLLILGFVAFTLGFLGGGDAKLMGAAGLWLGFSALPQLLVMTILAGGVLGLGVLLWSFVMFEAQLQRPHLTQQLDWVKPSVPYGFAIAAGTILAFPDSWLAQTVAASTWLTQI